jgi:hypothetical protein
MQGRPQVSLPRLLLQSLVETKKPAVNLKPVSVLRLPRESNQRWSKPGHSLSLGKDLLLVFVRLERFEAA